MPNMPPFISGRQKPSGRPGMVVVGKHFAYFCLLWFFVVEFRTTELLQFKWVWVKIKPPDKTGGFSLWFHLPGQAILGTYF